MSILFIYLIGVFTSLVGILKVILIVSMIIAVLGIGPTVVILLDHDEEYKPVKIIKSIVPKAFLFIIFGALLLVAIPSKKTSYTMLGLYYGNKFVKLEKVQNTGEKIYKLLDDKLDKELDKIKE